MPPTAKMAAGGIKRHCDLSSVFTLRVDNLSPRTTPEDLRRHFEKYGELADVYLPKERHGDSIRGYAFVRYYDHGDAEDALECMDGKLLDGLTLAVKMAQMPVAS